MKRNLTIAATTLLVAATMLSAGGKKVVAPVDAPVKPIPPLEDPSPFYLGAGLIWGVFNGICGSEPDCTYEDVTYGAMVRGGYEYNEYFGIEARALKTWWDADDLGGEKLQHIGLFAKPMYPISEDFNIYGLLGYGWTKTDVVAKGTALPEIDEWGFSAGIGIEYDLSDKEDDWEEGMQYDRPFDGHADQEKGWGLFIDYQYLLLKSDVPDLYVVSAGVTYDF